ncbi:hypothetical protein GCM10017576_31370 [Microbacterium barkeri]|uniref:Uncharacterized protein n=1 Tax=Microbacterium barkeri TaxID=33917 RepID=A0A9W6H617_9MICO|nr:hypothetical protein [Microbacterium barkeri]GLJ63006.1 hypothetical protein GCM10017576_31370 [Microbacterium barkeri]
MRRLLLPTLIVAAVVLTGCAPSDTPTAAFQDAVATVAEQAADGDAAGALASLDRLEADVDEALVDGRIDAARAVAIREAIDAVRADLERLAEPSPTPTPSEEPVVLPSDPPAEDGAGDGGDGDEGEGNGSEGNGNQGGGNGSQGNGGQGNGNQGGGNQGGGNGGQGNGKK